MQKLNQTCSSWTAGIHPALVHCVVFEPESSTAFETIETIIATSLNSNHWKLNFGNNQPLSPLGLCTRLLLQEKAGFRILTIQWLDNFGQSISEPTRGSPAVKKHLAPVKDITAQEPIQQTDKQKQQQQQLSPWGSCWLSWCPLPQPPPKSTYQIGTGRWTWLVEISGSKQHDQVALMSPKNQDKKGKLLHMQGDSNGFEDTQETLAEWQEVVLWVAKYTKPAEMVQRVCADAAEIIRLPKEVPDLKA